MRLREIYRPIEEELKRVEKILESSLKKTDNSSILQINNFLLNSHGKRIRPALMILSAKATLGHQAQTSDQLIKIASAIELIHMASLIHDDVIDHSNLRHNKPTVNSKWGEEVSIALGDYLYSVAFELISDSGDSDVIGCISSATKAMCEGELIQVCERDNLNLLRERYIFIIKKKTASLFAASCQAGSLISNSKRTLQSALREYGLNFGIAFQMIDDYLDLVGEKKNLGKMPGQDIEAGEITLPLLDLFESVDENEREELKMLLNSKRGKEFLEKIKPRLVSSGAVHKTKEAVSSYITFAKEKINILSSSPYKENLLNLSDFIMERGFNGG